MWMVPLLDGGAFGGHLSHTQSTPLFDAVLKQREKILKRHDLTV
jgi:hypothetical protein